jgi:hypothetical protein
VTLDVLRLRPGLLAGDRAVDRVDQTLNFHEFRSRPLRLVAVEGSGQHPGVGIACVEPAPFEAK